MHCWSCESWRDRDSSHRGRQKALFQGIVRALFPSQDRNGCRRAESLLQGIDLSEFDIVIPRVRRSDADFAYVLLGVLEDLGVYSPISRDSILYGFNEYLIPFILGRAGVETLTTLLGSTRAALEKSISRLRFPVVVKLPHNKDGAMIVDSEKIARCVLDTLESLGEPIIVQEMLEGSESFSILYIGERTYCIEKHNGTARKRKLGIEEKRTARRMTSLLGASVCQLNGMISGDRLVVIDLNINPWVHRLQEHFKTNLFEKILDHLESGYSSSRRGTILDKFLKWFEEMRW